MTSKSIFSRLGALFGVVGALGASLSGCGGGGGGITPPPGSIITPGTTPFTNSRQASAAACQANPHQNGRKIWTVLVYVNAASNLQPDSLLNVGQLASVGSNGNVNVVVQWKQANLCPYFSSVNNCGNPSFVGTHRYYILPHSAADVAAIENGNTTPLEDPAERLPDPSTNINGTSDMGDWRTLQNFVQWGEQNYPADNMIVVVWDHGSGALPVLNRSAGRGLQQATRAVSQDANTGNQITTQQLAQALTGLAQPLDALVIDCSLQATAEVAYQVRSVARVMVGSEESPPGAGYPYDVWLQNLETNALTPCDAGNDLIRDTLAEYNSSSYTDITQAMFDLSEMGNVGQAINAFGNVLNNHVTDQATLLHTARLNAQYFEFPEYKDLYDFADDIRTSPGAPSDMVQAAYNVEASLVGSNGALLAFGHGVAGQTFSTGLSIYLPGPQEPSSVDNSVGYDPVYSGLALAQDAPGWPTFLQHQQQ